MITLKKLQWDNCFSYGSNNSIDLDDTTVTQLLGRNGAGKSSIPLILEEVLFNKNSKGIKKAEIQNREYNKGYNIFLDFSVENEKYRVEVRRSRGAIKVKLFRGKEDISSHTATNTYKTVEDILGLDFKTFSQLVYQSTNASLQFLTTTDANRKKFLVELFGVEEYGKYYEVFKEVSKDINTKVTALSAKSDTILKWLIDNKLSEYNILPELNLPKISEEEETRLRSLQLDFGNISEKNKKIRENNTYKELLSNISPSDFTLVGDENGGVQETEELTMSLGTVRRKIDEAAQELSHLTELDKECPTCHQEVDPTVIQNLRNQSQVKSQTAEEEELHLNVVIERVKRLNGIILGKHRKQKEFEDLYTRINRDLEVDLLDGQEIDTNIKELKLKISTARSELEEVINENSKRQKHNTRLQVINEQTAKFEQELAAITEELSEQEKISTNLDVLKKAFSTNGLIAYKLENLVKEFEDLTNEYLAELSDGRFNINFVVENDKLNVSLSDNGINVDILALSSGELARVNTATLISIRKLMSSISKSRINVLFLDEVINVLDELGREKLVEVLLTEEGLNTYIVSHGWTHPLLEKVEVIKESNISRLE
jgi:DNA repair exonuclease SbcCD ATPase subunit|tara:strand:+ start:2825 stop:4630 length:1806 start_codon:yes stop_codon:yes gene_type:complete